MRTLRNHFKTDAAYMDSTLGVGRSCDMVSRDYVIGGKRGRIWVVDGYGADATLERMASYWLSLSAEDLKVSLIHI